MDDDLLKNPFGSLMEIQKKRPGKPSGVTTKKSNLLPKGQQTMTSFFKKSNEISPEKSNNSSNTPLARTRSRAAASLDNKDKDDDLSDDNDKIPISKPRSDKYKASDIKKPTPPINKKIPFSSSSSTTNTYTITSITDNNTPSSLSKRPSALTGATTVHIPTQKPIKPTTTTSTSTSSTSTSSTSTTKGNKRKKEVNNKDKDDEEDDYLDFIPSSKNKVSNYSLDDILKEKSEKGAFLENVDTDSLLFRKDDPSNRKQKLLKDDHRHTKIDVKNILADTDFKKEEIDQLQGLIVSPDLFLEESFQKCIDTTEIIPDVMRISFPPSDLLKYPILQLIGTSKTFNYALLNTLFCMVDISRQQDIPTVLINYLFSIVCYGKNDIIVSQTYKLLESINIKLFDGNLISNHFSFNDFFSVFKSYKIKMDFDKINDFKDTSSSYSSSSSTVNYTFPTINLYRVLCLLKTTITCNNKKEEKEQQQQQGEEEEEEKGGDGLKKFTIYQVKEMIKFLILLSMDPHFLPKIPMNQSNVTTASGKKSLSSIPQALHKDDVTNNMKLYNRVSLLKSILNILLNYYLDEKSYNSQPTTTTTTTTSTTSTTTTDNNNNNNEQPTTTTTTTTTTTGFKLEESMNELFEEIIELIEFGSNFRFSLFTKIAQILPTNTPSRIHERFSLFCIYKLLEQDRQNKEFEKEKRKQRKLKKSNKKSNKKSSKLNGSGNDGSPLDLGSDDDDKMKVDNDNNNNNNKKTKEDDDSTITPTETPSTSSQEITNITTSTTTTTTTTTSSSSQDNNAIASSSQDNNNNIASSQDNNAIASSQEQQNTNTAIDSINNNDPTALLPLKPINIIDLLKSNDVVDSLIQLVSNFVLRIRNDDFNEVIMVNLVQLARLAIDDVKEIKKHSHELENIVRTWNLRIKEPETIDFNRSRIKDTLVLIQSKISGLIINKHINTIDNYFSKA